MIRCPKCNSEKFYYEQAATLRCAIYSIDPSGIVDTIGLVKTCYGDDTHLACLDCGLEISPLKYLAMKEIVEEETKAQEEAAND